MAAKVFRLGAAEVFEAISSSRQDAMMQINCSCG